jgi:acrylyl-CoA reductase (NADPH)/3-hydroxypropionyl-CoA dehydratase/3-hydroxypropionyl-CoA synthetase
MAADFRIQGYERNDGSHGQFLAVQGPQLHRKLGASPSRRRAPTA